MDITYDRWKANISDPAVVTVVNSIGTTVALQVPPVEFLWKLTDGYKKAQDSLNVESGGGTVPQLSAVDLFQLGPTVETNPEGKPYIRGRAQMQCIIFLDSNDVRGVTLI